MRRIPCFALLCIFAFPYLGYSQFGNESPIPYFRYSVTAGLGPTLLYGDLDKRQIGGALYLRGNYFITHGFSIGLELQEGVLRGVDKDSTVIDSVSILRKTTNFFHAAVLGVNFQPFKYFQDDYLRRIEYRESFGKRTLNSLFVGVGIGAVYNLQWEGQGTGNYNSDSTLLNGSISYLVSTNAGIELPLHSLKPNLLDSYVWNLVARGQLNFSLDDELDGFSGNPGNKHRDIYAMLSLGVNLRF